MVLASCMPPPSTLKIIAAESASSTRTHQLTRCLPLAGSCTAWRSRAGFSSTTPFTCRRTVASIGEAVLFCTIAPISTRSPATKKRGVTGRISKSLLTTISVMASPTRVSRVTPRRVTTQVVRLSGRANSTCPCPEASVSREPFQYAVSRKSLRSREKSSAAPPPPPPKPRGSSGIRPTYAAIEPLVYTPNG